jgi:tetratricopeptide (TPR) repeat protein
MPLANSFEKWILFLSLYRRSKEMTEDTTKMDPFSKFLRCHPQLGERVLELNWEGQSLLDAGRIKAAERKFHEATRICECAIPALNNLALCAQLRGDTKRAIRAAHRALEFHSTDVFAHCTLTECYEELGRTERARSHVERAITLLEDPDVPLDKLTKVIEALAQLRWDEKIGQVYRSYREGVGVEDVLDGISWFYLGVAAANLGRMDEALFHWERARKKDPKMAVADLYATVMTLVQDGKVPPFRFSYRLDRDTKPLDPKHPSENLKPVVANAIWNEEEDHRHALVELLGMWEDVWAEEFLRLILIQPDLPDDLKVHAASALVERGVIGENEGIEMFIHGTKHTVVVNRKEIIHEPLPAAVEQFKLGLAYRQSGNITAAEEAYRKALKSDPDFAEAMVNLANICRSSDRSEEGEHLLKEAIELNASPTAILNLAALYLLEQERMEEGQDLISAVSIEDVDGDLLPLYYRILGHAHVFNWEFASAREAFQQLIALQPEDETAKDLLDWVAAAEDWRDRDLSLRNQRRARYLRQPVTPEMPLMIALHTLTRDNLIGITHWYDISYGTLRKAELTQMLADYLWDEEIDIWMDISVEARQAMEFLHAAGGSAPLAQLEAKFGSTEDDSIDWRYSFPTSPIGELQVSGIVFVGKDSNQETIAFIPKELLVRLSRWE